MATRRRRPTGLRPRISRPRVVLTTSGWMGVGLALAVAVAAANSGANILFLVSGVLVGAIVVSFVGAWRELTAVTIIRRLPATVHAGQSFTVELHLTNRKGRPAHALQMEDLVRQTAEPWRVFTPRVAARTTRNLHYPARVMQRGVVQFEGVRLSTVFPFGLVRASMLLTGGTENELVVYPALGTVRPSFFHGQLPGVHERASPHPSRIGATDIHGLREYRSGDNPKWIHWRRSASLGRPLVKEFDREEARRIHVVLDAVLAKDAEAPERERLERAISFTATLAAASTRATREVGLTVLGRTRIDRPAASGVGQVRTIMEDLARLQPVSDAPDPPAGRSTGPTNRRGGLKSPTSSAVAQSSGTGGPSPSPSAPVLDRYALRNTAVILVVLSADRLDGLSAAGWQASGGSVRVINAASASFGEVFEPPAILGGPATDAPSPRAAAGSKGKRTRAVLSAP